MTGNKSADGTFANQQLDHGGFAHEGELGSGAPQRESLPPMTLPSGAIYTGQWLNGMKDGYGHQVWPDGSKYEGEWQADQANGFGKLVHADGDVYEG